MKKRILSAAVILLLLLSLPLPAARADTLYPAPDAVDAGQPINHLVATVASGARVDVSGLPAGLRLDMETQGDQLNLYLRGSVSEPGSYDCVININDTRFTCALQIRPETPGIFTGPDQVCYYGDELQIGVTPSVGRAGQLSYQWYVSERQGELGMPVDGAIDPELPMLASRIGTQYYVCKVTNTIGGVSASAFSQPITVRIEELTVTAIAVESMPARREYTVGDTLDTTGLSIRASLANGDSRIVFEDFGVWPTRLEKAGEQSIELSYQGQKTSFTVQVKEGEEQIDGIGVLSLPNRTNYALGERLDIEGLRIRVHTNNGPRDVSEGLSYSPSKLDTPGQQTITVRYGGKSCTFTVQVSDTSTPVNLTVSRLPDKLHYTVGDELDTAGLVLRQINSQNEAQEIRSGYTCTPTVLEQPGRQEITVSYGELSSSFHVTVGEAPPASPSPSVTPAPLPSAPVSPQVTPAPGSAHSSPARGGARTLFVITIIAALIALAALGAYVFIMNRGGVDPAIQAVRQWLERLRRR